MSGHKGTKFVTFSGFRAVEDRSLLASHLVTLTLNLIFKLLGHTLT
jgi:hypothetical protein